ncbi:MAG: DDE transposase family protein [Microcoleaceae cyanobacterium]
MSDIGSDQFYIVKQPDGHCEVIAVEQEMESEKSTPPPERWGPYNSRADAIAKRVGLIRAGKCQPQ